MSWSFNLVRILGIQVRVHVTFVLILLWGAYYWSAVADDGARGAVFGVIATLLLFLCVTAHEFGHSIQARAYGIEVKDITLYPIGGIARISEIPEQPIREFKIAIAGPMVNVAIVGLLVLVGLATGRDAIISPDRLVDQMREASWWTLLPYITFANIALALFNLLPAFPMDGGRILRSLLAMKMDHRRATRLAATVGQMMAFFFGFYGFATGQIFLILIAIFVWMGASQEGQEASLRQLLGPTTVGEAMIRQPWSLTPEAPLRRAVELTLSTAQSDFPVLDRDGRVVGLLTMADLLAALPERPDARIADVMQADFPAAREEERIVDIQARLADKHVRALPVVTSSGGLAGLLTMTDIAEVIRVLNAQPGVRPAAYGAD
jgi:stage IV sporulation protein FB